MTETINLLDDVVVDQQSDDQVAIGLIAGMIIIVEGLLVDQMGNFISQHLMFKA